MDPRDEPFQPEHVDERIEWLAQHVQEGAPERDQSAQLIQRLQRHYTMERQKDTLNRAWEHIAQRYEDSVLASSTEAHTRNEQIKLERPGLYHMQQKTVETIPVRRPFPRWGVMVAVAVTILLIASTAAIMSQVTRLHGNAGTGGHPPITCPTPRPTPPMQPTPTPPMVIPTPTPTLIANPTPTPGLLRTPSPSPTPTPPMVIPTPTPAPTPIPTPAPTGTVSPPGCVTPTPLASPTPTVAGPPSPTPTLGPVVTPTILPHK